MRDTVEIGVGREARRTYRLADVSLQPARRTRSSKEVDTSWHIDAYRFDVPVVAHPTDALAGPEFVKEYARLGGLAIINAEGLWGRHRDVGAAVRAVLDQPDAGSSNRQLQRLHAAPIDEGLLAERIGEVRESGATVAARVSPQRARELAPGLVAAGVELLVIQGTIISAEHVNHAGDPLNLKDFIGGLDVPVIAGGVSDYTTALHLMRTGAVGVIVGSGTNTNAEALGIGSAMATAIADAQAARRDYLDETGGRYVHLLADGEIATSGDIAKAIACGADAVVVDRPLARAREAAGGGFYWPSVAAHPSFPRGRVERVAEAGERPALEEILYGPASEPDGTTNLVGGLRRAMAKCGYTDLKSFQRVGLTVAR
ncbi:GuaB3 family IMP dehydrogenase-related protein [Corynebacterium otitidis]|uniref:GuaB3 family IMP dehydrogenase-related protein n=1 Tax=Corynebacterium otitidis TaxID=29321 RepID=UPI000627518E|nr:GuaB3 family IMP dehydrogenase-related protein [Corynebacterium otitidis]KKO84004.1 oxidoreductase [Corynebacterium otitidis]